MERATLPGDRGHDHDLVPRPEDASQGEPPLLEGQVEQPLAVEVEDVEHEVGDGSSGVAVQALAERVVVAAAVRVDDHQLAVEHGGPGGDADGEPGELGEPVGQVAAGRVHDPHGAVARPLRRADEGEHAVSAPGGLEQVVGGVEGVRARRRPHRGHVARARQRRLEPEVQLLDHLAPMVARPPGIDSGAGQFPPRPRGRRRRDPRPRRHRPSRDRRSPCPDLPGPTTCTASAFRSTRGCRPTGAWWRSPSSAAPPVATAIDTRSGSRRPTDRRRPARSPSGRARIDMPASRPTAARSRSSRIAG